MLKKGEPVKVTLRESFELKCYKSLHQQFNQMRPIQKLSKCAGGDFAHVLSLIFLDQADF